ncbi:CDP-glycerol glycerophosphotransferase family protein [Streptomyces sp. Da 82-17]|uniref:bifunctional glycosyltransferase/CDP-glycerol:glycerophosphate glycerophosphotransferase n=1 Tax=Streptomyces sp. Da 82-17 TaxID=3377116 RepID=UPI0038D3FD51
MPRFSVIVPAYNVQAYLHEALHSVLRQSFTDLELIAVDDCSPDGSGEIIDELAAADPRVRPVHLTENVGLGRARNAGMEHATGDYLVFLDGDDTLTPGALAATADRLKETGSPDVLVYDYARTYWTGREVRNMQARQVTEDGPAPFRLAERPGLLNLLMVVWNKAYSREFIAREGFRFPPGYYEDTPWTYPVLMAAETIATLDRVCVHYRQRRQGNILGTTSRKHFDIFDQYDRVFAQLDARPEFAEWRPVLFRRMVDHYATVFARPDRLPRGSRPEFLRRAREQYRRHHVPGLRLDPRTRLRHGLVRFAAHRTYRALRLAKAAKLRFGRAWTAVRGGLRASLMRLHYRVQLRLPVWDDLAVFTGARMTGHGGDAGAIEEKVRDLAPHLRTAWLTGPAHHHTVPTATRRITPGTAAYWTALARAKYLVLGGEPGHPVVKRRAQVRVQPMPGTPLKRMGLDLQDRPAAARGTDFAALLDDVDTWDYVLSANRHSTLVWERVLPGSYTTLEYGRPANDRLLQASSEDVAAVREQLGIPHGTVAVLYAPTFRDHRRSQHRPLDLDRVLRALGPRFTVLARAHPSYGEPLGGGEHARLVDVSGHRSVESLCLASDALLTDYSSLMFDYAHLDRPIVLYTDDQEVYEATRGTYFDLRSCPPGAVARDEDELIDIFSTGHWRGSRSAQLRAAFRTRFCALDDGRAAERVVRHVFLGQYAGMPGPRPAEEQHPQPAASSGLLPPPTTEHS